MFTWCCWGSQRLARGASSAGSRVSWGPRSRLASAPTPTVSSHPSGEYHKYDKRYPENTSELEQSKYLMDWGITSTVGE